jgi:hypothetical protein
MGWTRATPYGSPPAVAIPASRRGATEVNRFLNAFCDRMKLMEGAGWRASEDDFVEFFNQQFPEWGEDGC